MPASNQASIGCGVKASLDAGSFTNLQGNDGSGKEGSTYFADGSSRPDYDKIKIHIQNPGTERIYLGGTTDAATTVEMRVLDPNGNIIFLDTVAKGLGQAGFIKNDSLAAYLGPIQLGAPSCGYQAIEVRPSMAGAHTLEFRNITANTGKYIIHPFDAVVGAGGAIIEGRVYSKRWHLSTNSASNGNFTTFYTYTPDSVVVGFDLNGVQPFGFAVNFNRYGSDNTGNLVQDRRSNADIDSPAEYPVFLTNPDVAVWPIPSPIDFEIKSIEECESTNGYCILIHSNKETQYNVYVDVDGVAGYQPDGRDVSYPYRTFSVGTNCVVWDGRDNYGVKLAPGSVGNVYVEMLAGLTHFPVWDAEINSNGFNASILRPSGLPAVKMYWDNSKLTGARPQGASTLTNLDGCTSNCNIYNNSNNENVNTWVATVADNDSRAFNLQGFCDTDQDGHNDNVDQDDDNDGLSDAQEGQITTTVDVPKYAQFVDPGSGATNPSRAIGRQDGYPAVIANTISLTLTHVVSVPANATINVHFASAAAQDSFSMEAYNFTTAAWVRLARVVKPGGSAFTAIAPVAVNMKTFPSDRFRIITRRGTISLDALEYNLPESLTTNPDSDKDGTPNSLDLDSNNNGIPDLIEVGGTDINGDGHVDGLNANGTFPAGTDTDGDGWADALDNSGGSTGTSFILRNVDGDAVSNYLDLDDDNDGIPDLVEVGGIDADGDGRLDQTSDADSDGLADLVDPVYDAATGTPVTGTPHYVTAADGNANNLPDAPCATCDFDGDGMANEADLDADGDGVPDSIESGNADFNKDGVADNGVAATFVDANADGLTDTHRSYAAVSAAGSGAQAFSLRQNVDGDTRPNWLDIDADNDGITDNTEAFATTAYTPMGGSYNGDGLNSAYDNASGTHGGNTTPVVDSDTDDTPDYLDLDSDNDSSPDRIEGHDTDGDGLVDAASASNTGMPTGIDADQDGLDDGYDNNTAAKEPTNGSLSPSSEPKFTTTQADQDWRYLDLNLSGSVWNDENMDGIFSAYETGIASATVELLQNGLVVATTTTNASGVYMFLRQASGSNYAIRVLTPAGFGTISPQNTSWSEANDSDVAQANGTSPEFTLASGTSVPLVGAGFQAAPLPVELIAFSAKSEHCTLNVAWQTASESGTSHFVLQRSADAKTWETLTDVPAKGAASSYGLRINASGKREYLRLLAVGFDESAQTSEVISATATCVQNLQRVLAFPNPVASQLELRNVDPNVETVALFDNLGRAHLLRLVDGRIDLGDFAPGTYTLVVSGQHIQVVRL